MHLSETRGEVEHHRKETGHRPIAWLEKIGFLGPGLTAAHCVWVTINEVRTLARHGVSVAHCPVSNMKLASGGVAPVPEMLREGVVVGLGTDSPISNNAMDVFADMKIASLLHKATRWDARAMPAQAVLDLATIGAARALHVDSELGSIEVGKRADLAVVSLQGAHTTPFYPETLISQLVYSCRGAMCGRRLLMARFSWRTGSCRPSTRPRWSPGLRRPRVSSSRREPGSSVWTKPGECQASARSWSPEWPAEPVSPLVTRKPAGRRNIRRRAGGPPARR